MSFELGFLAATPGALAFCNDHDIVILDLVMRHEKGDWGDLDESDRIANVRALSEGSRIFSSYDVGCEKVWVITEADRSSTLVLLPEEY